MPGPAAVRGDRIRVEQILRQAADVDAGFAAVLARAADGEITDQDATSLAQAADAGAVQSDNRAWWDSLSVTTQGAILRDAPDLVRNLDGVPVTDREAANRLVLQREIARLQKDPGDAANSKLRGLNDIGTRLAATGPGKPRAYLVQLDTGGDGKAVLAAGNPGTATDVATYVPGTGTELGKIGGDLSRSDKMW
ncbi:hypothetical protein [Amycolatopsis sp. FDAARGOS 1241]|uniref:hypothetical protein n=1 Tax=Amycolatopsis sp. FDAARGOS 1241 TaxID=2778070 RepID=UPI001EF2AF50|nr:hypothetical protein [Amycolatopsis sp. FDAARGOS 1241]